MQSLSASNKEVSILYYPTQVPPFPVSHAKFEVDGTCYTLCGKQKEGPIQDKIRKAAGGGFAFFRISISVTEQQFEDINKHVLSFKNKPESINCIKAPLDVLSIYADFYVPPPVSLFPTLTAAYLGTSHLLGSKRITSITRHCHHKDPVDRVIKLIIPLFSFAVELLLPIYVMYRATSKLAGF